MSLPEVDAVKPPGCPKKINRLNALKNNDVKDSMYRRNRMVYGKRAALQIAKKDKGKAADRNASETAPVVSSLEDLEKEFNTFDFDINEVLTTVPEPN